MLLALHKPFGVLSQFTPDHPSQRTLAEFGLPPGVYPVGRLDADSEGLLLLSDEPGLNTQLLDPRAGRHPRRYWAQVEGEIDAPALRRLAAGEIILAGRRILPARAWRLDPSPAVTERAPPVRVRAAIPTSWLALELVEGRNRQVRRMTAAVGFPTLRLIRVCIGNFALPDDLVAGTWRELNSAERRAVFSNHSRRSQEDFRLPG